MGLKKIGYRVQYFMSIFVYGIEKCNSTYLKHFRIRNRNESVMNRNIVSTSKRKKMKKNVFFKNMRRVLPLCLVFLVAGLTSCNNSLDTGTVLSWNNDLATDSLTENGVEGCFSACITSVKEDNDTVKATILEIPEDISENRTYFSDGFSEVRFFKGQYALFLKSDLRNYEIHLDDIIDFSIIHFERFYMRETSMEIFCEGYLCRTKPCE